jgi:hypothetical protein
MPAIKCANGKWKWGERGACIYMTKEKCEQAGKAIQASQQRKTRKTYER